VDVKTRAIPVIIGATGTVSKSLRKYVSTIPGTSENCHIGHGTHTPESADVKVH
jgi:hypothetical protein